MKFGFSLVVRGNDATPETFAAIAERSEALGLDSLWLSAHVILPPQVKSGYVLIPGRMHPEHWKERYWEPFTVMSYLAGITSRITLGTSVVVLPMHNPFELAKQVAEVDQLSGGRFVFGVGVGWFEEEFEVLNQDFGNRGRRTDEALQLMQHLWRDEPVTFKGRYYSRENAHFGPKPVQRPRPPIWVVGQSKESIDATLARGFNLVSGGFGVSIERLREFRQHLDGILASLHPRPPFRVSTQRPVYVTHDESELPGVVEQARWNMRVTLSLRQGLQRVDRGRAVAIPFDKEPSTEDLLERYFIMGTPQRCIEQLHTLREVMGIDHFNANFWFGDLEHEQVLRSMQLFHDEVMPAFR